MPSETTTQLSQEASTAFWREASGLISQLSLTLTQMKEAKLTLNPEVTAHEVTDSVAVTAHEVTDSVTVATPEVTDSVVTDAVAVHTLEVTAPEVTYAVAVTPLESMKVIGVRILPSFVKKSFNHFKRQFIAIKKALHALRGSGGGARGFQALDVQAPSQELLLASLMYLDTVLQLIASCIPLETVSDCNRRHALLTTNLVKLFSSIFDLFEAKRRPYTQDETVRMRAKFYSSKVRFQSIRREVDKREGKMEVSMEAFNATSWHWDKPDYFLHIEAAVKFASHLTKICYIMMSQLITKDGLDPEGLRGTITAHKYFWVQSPDMDDWRCYSQREQPEAMLEAFNDLDYYINYKGHIIYQKALEHQKNSQAVLVYTVLWHVLTFMQKNKLITQDLAIKLNYKFSTLSDKRCNKYYIDPHPDRVIAALRKFWDAGYTKCCTSFFQVPVADAVPCEEFCLAMLRFALMNTPQSTERSAELAAWIALCANICQL
jgi:hypothetical protein